MSIARRRRRNINRGFSLSALRAATGDSHMLGLYHASTNLAVVSGGMDTWNDVRGGGFGPQINFLTARPPVIGTQGTNSAYVYCDGTGAFATAVSAIFGTLQGARGVLWFGFVNEDLTISSFKQHMAMQTAGSNSMVASTTNGGSQRIFENPGFTPIINTHNPRMSPKFRVFKIGKDAGTNVSLQKYPGLHLTGSAAITVVEATNFQIMAGANGSGAAASVNCGYQIIGVYDRDPTPADVINFTHYALSNTNLGAHKAKLCVLDGDSITDADENSWAAKLDRDAGMSDWDVTSYAQSGDRAYVEGAARVTAIGDILRNTPEYGTTKKILVKWLATNDIFNDSRTGIATEGVLATQCAQHRADGYKVLVIPPLPRTTNGRTGEILVCKNRLLANWSGYADRYWDPIDDIAALNDATNVAVYPDGAHPAQTYRDLILGFVKTNILAM